MLRSGTTCFSLSTLKFRRCYVFLKRNQLLGSGEEWKIALIERPLMKEVKLAVDSGFYLNPWGLHGVSSLTLLLWSVEVTEIRADKRRIPCTLLTCP